MPSNGSFPTSSPEAQGISSRAILSFIDAAEAEIDAIHSFILLRHGHNVAQGWWVPYAPEYPHMLFSLSKSFTSTAIGLAIEEGRLTLDDPVVSFFPDDAPEMVSDNLAAMHVRHLLSMSTGHVEDTTGYLRQDPDGNWVRAFLARPVDLEPGSHFLYNSGATYMLSAILQKLTGVTLVEYLKPRLFQPLSVEDPKWETCPRGINTGGWGLYLKTEDIARFGQLYLQMGNWQDRQLVPESWIRQATSFQIANSHEESADWRQGYGYQFWRSQHGAFRGDGAFGQFCIVMPDQDAVLAITAGVPNMQAVLDLVWEHLLPALGPQSMPADLPTATQLAERLSNLGLPTQSGKSTSPLVTQVSGRWYEFEANDRDLEAICLEFNENGANLTLRDARGDRSIVCGYDDWRYSFARLEGEKAERVAASGAWIQDNTYRIKLALVETAFCPTITCRFVDGQVFYDFRLNVSFGPTEFPQVIGRV